MKVILKFLEGAHHAVPATWQNKTVESAELATIQQGDTLTIGGISTTGCLIVCRRDVKLSLQQNLEIESVELHVGLYQTYDEYAQGLK